MPIAATTSSLPKQEAWPALPLAEWKDTQSTLHMWLQVVGKVRLEMSPHMNHWWEVPLYVGARGLTTSPIPYRLGIFEVEFDFVEHVLRIVTSQGQTKTIRLEPKSVAPFYSEFMTALHSVGVEVHIWPMPVEIPNPIPFDQDTVHASYDPVYANRFWRILVTIDTIFKQFRARFIGKASPVHFFWGSFDMAVTRFSGRPAPPRPGADKITRDAYSHEEISAGWWPGGGDVNSPAFYAYAAPEPTGFRDSSVKPAKAFYDSKLGEFLLSYDDVRNEADPKAGVLDFLESTYEAGANLGKWDRRALEKQI
jgi:hypothetical protein